MNKDKIIEEIAKLDPNFGHALWHALKYREGQLYHIYLMMITMANAKEIMDKETNGQS